MVRKVFRQALPFVASFALVAAGFGGTALWRRAQDTSWCQRAAAHQPAAAGGPTDPRPPPPQPAAAGDQTDPSLLKDERAACVIQRHRQRSMFGSVWRTGGQEAAE